MRRGLPVKPWPLLPLFLLSDLLSTYCSRRLFRSSFQGDQQNTDVAMSHDLNQVRNANAMISPPHNARALAEKSNNNPAAAPKVPCPPHLSGGRTFTCYAKQILVLLSGNREGALSKEDRNWMRTLCLKCAYIFDGPTDARAHLCLEHYEERKVHKTCFRCGQVHQEEGLSSHNIKFPSEFTHISRYASRLEPALQKLYKERDEELTPLSIRQHTDWEMPNPPYRPESCCEGVALNCSWTRDAGMTEEEENWVHRSCFACSKSFVDTTDLFIHNINSHKEWFVNEKICSKCFNHNETGGDHTLKIPQGAFTDLSHIAFSKEIDYKAMFATLDQFARPFSSN